MSRQLSPRSTLDLCKQEAKRWHNALKSETATGVTGEAWERLRRVWPAAPQQPSLRDVQFALAREYGYDGWNSLRNALHDLIIDRQGREERVRAILLHGWDGDTALARRTLEREPAIAELSLPLAAACGNVDTVRQWLTRDPASANAVDPVRGWSPLAHVSYGRIDGEHAVTIASLLLEHGADPNFRWDDGWGSPFTVLTGVVGQGEGVKTTHPQAQALADLLVARGADPFDSQLLYNTSIVHDDIHWTAWLWQHCEAQGRMAPWHATDGTGLNGPIKVGTLNYLLGNAVTNGHARRVQWLLEHGADANTVHGYSGKPVHSVARLAGYPTIVRALEAHGARAEVLSGSHALLAALMEGDEAEARRMVEGAPALIHDATVLIAAAGHGRTRAVQLLLALGANADATDDIGATALHRAAHAGALDTIEALLAAGATVDVRETRWNATPLGWAIHLGQVGVARRLAMVSADTESLARLQEFERQHTESPHGRAGA